MLRLFEVLDEWWSCGCVLENENICESLGIMWLIRKNIESLGELWRFGN